MLRRTIATLYYWSRYRHPFSMPKMDGPPPPNAPQKLNATVNNSFLDPINDPFPVNIRGPLAHADVPPNQFINQWFALSRGAPTDKEYTPWRVEAPEGSYRFRPFPEFDKVGRSMVEKLRGFDKEMAQISRDSYRAPFRDAYLTKMKNIPTRIASMETVMERATREIHGNVPRVGPLDVQRDTGRLEETPRCSQKMPVDKTRFPFSFHTEDWYEYEVFKAQNKRFLYENGDSEATYKIIVSSLWDHHVERLALDIWSFVRDIGRQIVEEYLHGIRKVLVSLCSNDPPTIENELRDAFHVGVGPLNQLPNYYDEDEMRHFLQRKLRELEGQCVSILNRSNAFLGSELDIYDQISSWPVVERLEPWAKMVEYWTQTTDATWTATEMSTRKVEFRRFFRVIKVSLPFQSTEFENRLKDTRHWLHRKSMAEFHVIHKRNVVFNALVFPVERDPLVPASHEHHRLFSFALDWQSAPFQQTMVEPVKEGDTWETLARDLGTTVGALKECNANIDSLPAVGNVLHVPRGATKHRLSSTHEEQYISLVDSQSTRVLHSWVDAAAKLGCEVHELQEVNPHVYVDGEGKFPLDLKRLQIPQSCIWGYDGYSYIEPTFENDTFSAIALRVGCSEAELRAENASIQDPSTVREVKVPRMAKHPRRKNEPLLAPPSALFSNTQKEMKEFNLPPSLPQGPSNASSFVSEFPLESTQYPQQSMHVGAEDNWLSYTAAFLDTELSSSNEPAMSYNTNKLWPMNQVPGTLDSTPFEEDQTWFLHNIPLQQKEFFHPEGHIQDLDRVNHEQFPVSLDWQAP